MHRLITLLLPTLAFSMSASASAQGPLDATEALTTPLPTPPHLLRFRRVSEGLYRGSQPTSPDLAFLKDLGIRTVISFVRVPTDVIDWEREETRKLGMQFFSFPIHSYFVPKREKLEAIFAEILRPENQPVFIHCKHGKDRTGLIAGLYRVHVQNWSQKEAFQEALDLGFNRGLFALWYAFGRYSKQKPWNAPMLPLLQNP